MDQQWPACRRQCRLRDAKHNQRRQRQAAGKLLWATVVLTRLASSRFLALAQPGPTVAASPSAAPAPRPCRSTAAELSRLPTFLSTTPALLAIEVGHGSSLAVGGSSGTITNDGTLRVLTGAGVQAGATFTPISAGAWGDRHVSGHRGDLDTASHVFTASSVTAGTAGTAVTLDRGRVQRLLITDSQSGGTGWTVGASSPLSQAPQPPRSPPRP